MADYFGAFKQGLGAAAAAELARKEIDSIFGELDRQVREGTDGKIAIDRREYEVQDSSWPTFFQFPPKPKETYWVIAAHNPRIAKSPVKQLAKWTQHRAGYPCRITLESTEYTCEDGEALGNSLAELLRDPLVGEKLYGLMQLEEAQPEENLE